MQYKKVLLIKFGALGDIIHSTVIPQAIKAKHPNCVIHYLTSKTYVDLVENCPYIDNVIEYNNHISQTIKNLKKEKYDLIISLSNTPKSLFLSYLSFPKKVVFKSKQGISWVENYFYTAQKFFRDLSLPSNLQMSSRANIHNKIAEEMNKFPKPHIVLNPGGNTNNSRQGRLWNINKWKELSTILTDIYGGTIFVTGCLDERVSHMKLKNRNTVILSGKHSLLESCEVYSLADLVISGDSGPAHIASAYNIPVISILGSTSPEKIKPYGNKGFYIEPKTECKYCWKKKCPFIENGDLYTPCMESIKPQDVIRTIEELELLEKATKLLA